MSDNAWSELHAQYSKMDWINQPNLFALTAASYFPRSGSILELGAGLGQDSRYFASLGYQVTSTDIEASALETSKTKTEPGLLDKITYQVVDISQELPFDTQSFDVVYAHLSLHYFDFQTTEKLISEIDRVLKTGGIVAFLVNSTADPEYKTGKDLEPDYFFIENKNKRFFSINSARELTKYFHTILLDNHGETYKDKDKGVHHLIRYIGSQPAEITEYKQAIPFTGAIIERDNNGEKEVFLQTRWKPHTDPVYSGTFEFPVGVLETPYENVLDTLAHEIHEETGLQLKAVRNKTQTVIYSPQNKGKAVGFQPFCCTQQLEGGKPWIGFIFVCSVESGAIRSQLSEAKDGHWEKAATVKQMIREHPEQFFTLTLPAWGFYFKDIATSQSV